MSTVDESGEDVTVPTGHGPVTVPRFVMETWRRYGPPPDHVVRDMAATQRATRVRAVLDAWVRLTRTEGPTEVVESQERLGDVLVRLLLGLWSDPWFDSKRPFGRLSWRSEIRAALVRAGLVSGSSADDGEYDEQAADALVHEAITALATSPPAGVAVGPHDEVERLRGAHASTQQGLIRMEQQRDELREAIRRAAGVDPEAVDVDTDYAALLAGAVADRPVVPADALGRITAIIHDSCHGQDDANGHVVHFIDDGRTPLDVARDVLALIRSWSPDPTADPTSEVPR